MRQPSLITKTVLLTSLVFVLVFSPIAWPFNKALAAACTVPSIDYGAATSTITAPSTATYRLWTRMYVPDTTNKTYLLEVDGTNCFTVGGGTLTPTNWTWVDYHSGNTASKVQMSLSQGSHTVKLIGNAPGVKVDRIVAISDLNCVPSGFGDNCNIPDDTTPPTVTLNAPAEGATLSGTTKLTAIATDNTSVKKVEFYDNSSLMASVTSSPYEVTWDTLLAPNGTHLITARAYDPTGNTSSDSSTVSVKNSDTELPTQPTNVQAVPLSYNSVKVSWTASTDNRGVVGYKVVRNSVPVITVGTVTEHTDTGLVANTTYEYKVMALDGAGNVSQASVPVNVTTPTVPDTQPPSQPTGLTGKAVSPRQVNLTWSPSTDDTGVVAYDIYRATGNNSAKKIGTTTSTSFGDSTVHAKTTYIYSVVARDGAGNVSQKSVTAEVKTPSSTKRVTLTGTVSGSVVPYARVSVSLGSNKHVYRTDRYGRYAIHNLTPGQYNITFSARGYHSQTVPVNLNDSATQNVKLQKR